MLRPKRAATAAACALGITAGMAATATPAAASGTASAYYTCYADYPIAYASPLDWTFARDASGFLYIETSLLSASVFITPDDATGSLFWGPTPTITGMDVWNGMSAPVELEKAGTPALPSAPTKIDITSIPWGTVTSCYLADSGTGFPI
ncbi:MAG: hypothetical protein HOV68_29365 [Streptomycetaceae bacterium]|nr:hypothetical protein [Streptomycetaceae bacterium]